MTLEHRTLDASPAPSVGASEKTLRVLEAAILHDRFTDIVEETGLAKATVHRILATLVEQEFISGDSDRGYQPGARFLGIAGSAISRLDISAIAEPIVDELVREVKSAMTYPVISLCLVLGITAFLMLFIVPSFANIFDEMDVELPKLTAFVLGASDWMRTNVGTMVLGMAAAFSAIVVFKRTEKGKRTFDILKLKLPVFGPLLKKVSLARFSRTFGTLIKSGVPILGTLDIVADTSGNSVISDSVRASRASVEAGDLLSEPLSQSKVFPPMVVRMIAIGERSGALEALLEKIAEFYDREVKAQIKALTSLIEPILISFMGVIVGGVVMSVFLPILDIVGNIGPSQ